MIDHIELTTRRLAVMTAFYAEALAPLGYRVVTTGRPVGFGVEGKPSCFFLELGDAPLPPIHHSFHCSTRGLVDAACAAAVAAGGTDAWGPKLAPSVHSSYYCGQMRDPDGHLLEFSCHNSE